MKITKALTVSAIAYSTVLSVSANEYKNENVQLQDVINNLNCEQNLILADELFCWNGSKFQLVNFKKNLGKSEVNKLISKVHLKNNVEKSEVNKLISKVQSKNDLEKSEANKLISKVQSKNDVEKSEANKLISKVQSKNDVLKDIKLDKPKTSQNTYQPKDKLDEYIIKGATYSTKFVPLMNDGSDGSEYTSIVANDGKKVLLDAGVDFVNSTVNSKIQEIPFFAQTSLNISGGTESDTSFSINSLIKLRELAKDDEGDIKSLAFSQARFATATNAEGSTTNLGLGIRHRPSDLSMVGANAFWDYRMTDYSDAHSRLGLGGEYFWKDFEFRNNWYMAITDEKNVTIDGNSFKEKVVPGWDLEVGYRLPNKPELAFFVRGFNWDYKYTQDNSGLEGAVSWQATPHVGFEAFLSNEISAASTTVNTSLPGTDETFFGLRMNITGTPVRFEKSNYKQNMITQMTQPVKRKYDVIIERHGRWAAKINRN